MDNQLKMRLFFLHGSLRWPASWEIDHPYPTSMGQGAAFDERQEVAKGKGQRGAAESPKNQPFGGIKNPKTKMTMGQFHQFED